MFSCLLCSQKTYFKSVICNHCTHLLPVNHSPCMRCGIPIIATQATNSDTICEDCFSKPPPYMSCVSPFLYQFPLDQLIATMKYQGQPQLSRVLTKLMITKLEQSLCETISQPQALIPIPMHPRKQRQRGYNQAIYIANHLGKHFKIPVISNALLKTRTTEAQRALTAESRKLNLNQSFQINPKLNKQHPTLEHVALIDDVITTGATIEEASQCLKLAGIEQIDVWAIARTP